MFVKKWPLVYQNVNKTYLPTYLWDSSNSSDTSDSSDSSDSSDTKENFFLTKKIHKKTQTLIVIKFHNIKCDETQKLKLWWNSWTQILTKLKNSNCGETHKLKW